MVVVAVLVELEVLEDPVVTEIRVEWAPVEAGMLVGVVQAAMVVREAQVDMVQAAEVDPQFVSFKKVQL